MSVRLSTEGGGLQCQCDMQRAVWKTEILE